MQLAKPDPKSSTFYPFASQFSKKESSMIRARVFQPWCFVLLLVFAFTCKSIQAVNSSGYEIKNLSSGHAGGESVFWLDNERVLFVGTEPGLREIRKSDGKEVARIGLYTWDTRSDKVTRHSDLSGKVCFSQGYIRYIVVREEQVVLNEGPFRRERQTIRKLGANEDAGRAFVNPFTCKEVSKAERLSDPRPGILLKDGHGVLDTQGGHAQFAKKPVLFYPLDKKESITLPISNHDTVVVRYSEYLGAYVFKEGRSIFKGPQKVWYLYPDGRFKEVVVPDGPWMQGSTNYMPTKKGLFMVSHSSKGWSGKGLSPHNRGGFLVEDGDVEKLVNGYITGFAVSPNGCIVAMSIQSASGNDKNYVPGIMKTINLCAKGA